MDMARYGSDLGTYLVGFKEIRTPTPLAATRAWPRKAAQGRARESTAPATLPPPPPSHDPPFSSTRPRMIVVVVDHRPPSLFDVQVQARPAGDRAREDSRAHAAAGRAITNHDDEERNHAPGGKTTTAAARKNESKESNGQREGTKGGKRYVPKLSFGTPKLTAKKRRSLFVETNPSFHLPSPLATSTPFNVLLTHRFLFHSSGFARRRARAQLVSRAPHRSVNNKRRRRGKGRFSRRGR